MSDQFDTQSKSMSKSLAGAYLCAFLFGYHLGVVNAPLKLIAESLGFADSAFTMGAVVSSAVAGAFAGSVLGGYLADSIGRRTALLLNSAVLAGGALLCAAAPTTGVLLCGRALCGVGMGIGGSVVPVFIGEVAAKDARRGMFGTLNQVSICTGILASIVAGLPADSVNAFAASASLPHGKLEWWRVMFALGVVPAGLSAAALLKWAPPDVADPDVADPERGVSSGAKDKDMAAALASSRASSGWGAVFDERYRRAVLTGALLFVFQQFSGVNAVVFYSTSVFKSAGVSSAVLASALVALTNILGTLVASRVVDSCGRKPLLATSFAGMAATMLAMAAFPGSSALAVWGTVLYIAFFALGAGPVPALLLGEAMPGNPAVRGKAAALAMAAHWACNLVVGGAFLSLVNVYSVAAVYRGFGAVALAAAAFVVFAVQTEPRT